MGTIFNGCQDRKSRNGQEGEKVKTKILFSDQKEKKALVGEKEAEKKSRKRGK